MVDGLDENLAAGMSVPTQWMGMIFAEGIIRIDSKFFPTCLVE
jgi:hypothetical protein